MFSLIPWKKKTNGGLKEWNKRDTALAPMSRFREDFDALWDRFLSDWDRGMNLFGDDFRFGTSSRLEDRETEFVFRADLPGYEPEDIDVQVTGNSLLVKAEHRAEKKDDKAGFDYRYGSFQRYFALPSGINADRIEARYHSGVLEVRLPKTEDAMAKRIPVKFA